MPIPAAEPSAPPAEEPQTVSAPAREATDIYAGGGADIPVIDPVTMELDEYPSPAFMKRSRLSYGALFEDPDDKLEEDGGVKGKGRKRTRFGRDSSSWRYASQSPSPSPEAEPKTPPQTVEAAVEVDIVKASPPKRQMADEGSQTVDVEEAEAQAKQQVTKPPGDELRRGGQATALPTDRLSQPAMPLESQLQGRREEDLAANTSPAPNPAESDKPAVASTAPAPSIGFGSTTLFGNFAPSLSGYDQPRFGTAAHRETGGGLGIANQVRFGFSHMPQTEYPQQQPHQMSHSAPAPHRAGQDYPQPQLQPSDPSRYADMETYVDQAEQEMEAEPQYAYDGQDLNPPVSETFGAGQFDIATQAQEYNPVEGGHFGADALDEGTRITSAGYAIHNDEINVDKVPPGFASFGGVVENEIEEDEMDEDEDEEQPQIPGEDLVENDELEDDLDDEVAVDDRDTTEYGPEGEILEQGDYDQREYYTPEEDQDELSEEEHQDELQALAQNNSPDVIDEDELYGRRMDDNQDEDEEGSGELEDEQGSYDEEEDEYDEDEYDQGSSDSEGRSSEGSYSHGPDAIYDSTSQTWISRGTRPMQSATPSAPKAPVVIDLLSDSDDDEPPPQPVKPPPPEPSKSTDAPAAEPSRPTEQSASAPFALVPSEPVRQEPTVSRQNLSAGDQHDAVLEPSPGPEQRQAPREWRKSSGSHLYGGNAEEHVDDTQMDLHLPSTPPPEKQQEGISPTRAQHDVAGIANDDDDTASSIPGFNGAWESKVSRGTEHAEAVSGAKGAEDVPRETPHPSNDGGVPPAPEAQDSHDQEMADVVPQQRVSSPSRPVGDADESEPRPNSADMSKGDVAEVERLFEEAEAPGQDTAMAEGEMENAPSPRRSQRFESQVLTSSPLSKAGNLARPPTSVETQEGQPSVPRHTSSSDSPANAFASRQTPAEVPPVTTETTVEARVHLEQQAAISTEEEEGGFPKPDTQMIDAVADDEDAAPTAAEEPLTLTKDGDEDRMDMGDQIQAQLQVDMVETTVQGQGHDVTVVHETRTVSISHPDSSVAEASPVPALEPDRPDGDVPVEPASLDQAIQEELMLQEKVDEEIASQFEGPDDTAAVGNDEEGDDMEADGAGEDVVGVVVEEEVYEGARDAGEDEKPAEREVMAEERAVVPDEEEEEVIVIAGEEAHKQQEPEETHEALVDTAPSKPKQDLEVLVRPQTRSWRAKDQQSQSEEAAPLSDAPARETAKEASPEASKAPKRATGGPKRSAKVKETRDPSIELAKASLQKRGLGKRRLEEVAPEPRRTRQRSASLQRAASLEAEDGEEEEVKDSSVALAKASLASPSKKRAESVGATEAQPSRADLVKRLRVSLAEFTPLKALRHHKKGHPHILAVVACDPPEPQRTKHRDFHTTVTVTDASLAPEQVVEVQFMHMHKAYLPAVKQGDSIVLRDFEIVSLPDKQFALKEREDESSWAVYDADYEVPGGKGGPDFEIHEALKDYLHDLRVWYNDLDVLDREKLVTAVARLAETGHAEGATG